MLLAIAPDLDAARRRTLDVVADVTDADLERRLHPLMGPLVWDLGHIAAYEDLWLVHRYGERPLLRPDLAASYDAFETPRAAREDVEILGRDGAYAYLEAVRARTLDVLDERGPHPELHEMVLRHELQHTETILQAKRLGGLAAPRPAAGGGTGLELVEVGGGTVEIGASADGFAYDNERPRHARDLRAFRIGRTPVTNATWLSFAEGGGYVRREWWSDEGWAWKQDHDITHHADAREGDPAAPVCHVSWFEAEAFANAYAMRLPSETEWEHAATARDELGLDALGAVWEWTSSQFSGYPGFAAHPYREYSEVFFDRGCRVLRGGSCATHPRVASVTFRNWDLPQRRHLFAGLRLAADA
jgi:iron(II)-dependent oxidoreductase